MAYITIGEKDVLWHSVVFRFCVALALITSWPMVCLFLDGWVQSRELQENQEAFLRILTTSAVTGLMFYLLKAMSAVCNGHTKGFNYWLLTILGVLTITFIMGRLIRGIALFLILFFF